MKKKLTLNRETISILSSTELTAVQGGAAFTLDQRCVVIPRPTVLTTTRITQACTPITEPSTSVINPG